MKKKYIIATAVVVVIVIVAAAAILGTAHDSDPTHLVVTAPANMKEPDAGFNPITGWGCGHMNFNPLVQSTLFTTDSNGNLANDLATGYNISSDGLKWTVKIRTDAKYSNNKSVEASDVAFTFNEAKKENSKLDLSNLNNATSIGTDTVKFNLKEPQSTFIYKLRYVGIVPQESYNNETYGQSPIGSGPYKLQQYDKGQQAIFVANDNYYGKKPYFKQITMLFPTQSSTIDLAKSGQADVVQLPISDLNQSVSGYSLIDMPAGRAQGASLPYLNNTGLKTSSGDPIGNNVTADIAIRKALNVGINRQEIVNSVYKGHGSVEYTGVDTRDYANTAAFGTDNDQTKAKQILQDAGWIDTNGDGIREKNGQNATFKLYYSSEDQSRQALATVIAEQAKPLGINIQLVGTDWDTIYKNMFSSAALMQQTSNDPYKSIYQQYYTRTVFDDDYMNPNAYNSSQVNSILDQALTAQDQKTANQYWSQATYDGSGGFGPQGDAPWLWVASYDYTFLVKNDIDIGMPPQDMGQDFMANICDWKRVNGTADNSAAIAHLKDVKNTNGIGNATNSSTNSTNSTNATVTNTTK
jgi:peptide/nickel transport system substrate-binding protein